MVKLRKSNARNSSRRKPCLDKCCTYLHISFVGDVNDQSVTCHATLGTPNQAACENAVWQSERTGNLVLRPGEPPLTRTAGKS